MAHERQAMEVGLPIRFAFCGTCPGVSISDRIPLASRPGGNLPHRLEKEEVEPILVWVCALIAESLHRKCHDGTRRK